MSHRIEGQHHEPSFWLREVCRQALAELHEAGLDGIAGGTLVVPIHTTEPGTREDRECDRCGTWIRHGGTLFPFTFAPTDGVLVSGGLCEDCVRREWPDALTAIQRQRGTR